MSGKDLGLDLIRNLIGRTEILCELFYDRNIDEGLSKLLMFTEDLQVLMEWLTVNNFENTETITDLNYKLKSLIGGIEKHDYDSVGDVLQNEILSLLNYWEKMMAE
jgi:hypothetical protein